MPLDGIIQDWQYWGNNYLWNAMDFLNPEFPDGKKMVQYVHNLNAHMIISIWSSFADMGAQKPVVSGIIRPLAAIRYLYPNDAFTWYRYSKGNLPVWKKGRTQYARNMYIEGNWQYEYHIKKYGHP